jgi:hypothetical protein
MPIRFNIRTLLVDIAIVAIPLALVAQGFVVPVLVLVVLAIPLVSMPLLAADVEARWGRSVDRPMTALNHAAGFASLAILTAHALLCFLAILCIFAMAF